MLEEQAAQLALHQPSQINFNNHFILRGEKKKVEGGGGGGGGAAAAAGVYIDSKEEDAFTGADIATRVKIPPFFELKAMVKGGSGSVRPKSRSGRLEEATFGGGGSKDSCLSFVGNSANGIVSGVDAVVSGKKLFQNAPSEASSPACAAARPSTLPSSTTLATDVGILQGDM
jgi:hypothetical protein